MSIFTRNKKKLIGYISEGEGQFIEFKKSLEKIERAIVAFANTKGGIIYLGVDDFGKFVPFELTNKLKGQISNIVKNIDPSPEIDIVNLEKACAILVKEGEDRPYKCKDGFFIRNGAASYKLTRNEILDLAVKSNKLRFENLIVNEFKYPEDFSNDSLNYFVEMASLSNSLKSMGKESFLTSIGVAEKQLGKLLFNNVGILFFAKNPQKFLSHTKINYTRYQGETKRKVVDRKIITGNLMNQIEKINQTVNFDIPVQYELRGNSPRKEVSHYPIRAIEEAIVNAIIHRDYYNDHEEIMIDYYTDRIEISNPGGLLGSLKVENLGKRSMRRNLIIADLFFRRGRGEKLGSGIVRMKDLMAEWKLKAPVFEVEDDCFSIHFYGPTIFISEEKLYHLPDRPKQFMLEQNMGEQEFTAAMYASKMGVINRTAQKDLKLLIEEGFINKKGKGKNTLYFFVKS